MKKLLLILILSTAFCFAKTYTPPQFTKEEKAFLVLFNDKLGKSNYMKDSPRLKAQLQSALALILQGKSFKTSLAEKENRELFDAIEQIVNFAKKLPNTMRTKLTDLFKKNPQGKKQPKKA